MDDLGAYRRRRKLDELAELMRENPGMEDHLSTDTTPITVRYSQDDLERATALIPALEAAVQADPMLSAGVGKVTRGYVLRVATLHGLAALEAKHNGDR